MKCLCKETALDHVQTDPIENGLFLDHYHCPNCDTWYYVEWDTNQRDPQTGEALTTKEWHEYPEPKIVCLCGSTRFWRTFQQASLEETLARKIVLSIGAASGTDDDHFGNLPRDEYDRMKAMLDELHLRKIDLADEVLILDVDGYIGESTGRELAYARKLGKPVRFWSEEKRP